MFAWNQTNRNYDNRKLQGIMKELFKAKEIHEEIIKLDKDIISLERSLDLLIENESDGSIELKFNTQKKDKLKLDSDGSIISENDHSIDTSIYAFFIDSARRTKTDEDSKFREKFKNDLTPTEVIVVMASLLNYKKDKRKQLIKEFKNLSLKLKI